MSVGVNLNFSNYFQPAMSDEEMYANEFRLAIAAEDMGFDMLNAVEHHFDDYALCPNNFIVLANLAAKTKQIKLCLGAIVVPWHHDILRIAENIAQLDTITDGRLLVSFARGLAKDEYDGFRVDMAEARGRFDEATRFITETLRSGVAEYDGDFFKQPRVEIRPRMPRPLDGRLFSAATSIDSVPSVAKLGAGIVTVNQGGIEALMPSITAHREIFKETFGREAPRPTIAEVMFCHEDAAEAERIAREYAAKNLVTILGHYRLIDVDWSKVKGYEAYAAGQQMMIAAGKEALFEAYVANQLWGTPEQIIEKYRQRVAITGGHDLVLTCSFAGLPYDLVESSMRLFAAEALPTIHAIEREQTSVAA
ncbi:MAG: LLM class flavin-dependent oxidoreductase [Sphingopyxis macrogoltabida]|uniref:LLM class flavin-dependent oxidoreductase n=1 Tax=Sphingopyxis macrogoltabida TaxID=33050 RepID=A0A2W5KZL0_SPHMC|nr:MAG: LLM class flavin-dependent oxidoreductase [Sphingopyxis macrogoltabida]